uniref:NADH dehydrogenase subunit 2 n=1 Tax=Nihonogomphus lieftincki TaxID=1904530 RepID=UPI0023F22C5F|nr:NADH dehydrogenase subunit 2 [Nihonogomphus lieftincki]WDY83481.1 NADH dehydrogenase subunit 2 [Nihonogomphus lieftincki]
MMLNISSLLFLMSLMTGTLISISSSTWIGTWMGLEMNLLSFIPLMSKNKTPYENESSMKYFLVQAIASILFLLSILLASMMDFDYTEYMNYLMSSALLMKMGAAPFHFWFPGVMEGLNWMNCLILMTWQKIAPFIILSYKLNMSLFFIVIIILCVIVGSIGGLNQISLRKLMAYSSISHLGWMISAMLISTNYWIMYFIIYVLLNMAVTYIFNNQSLFQLSQTYYNNSDTMIKFSMFISMLSLGGLPPFLGFLPKWIVIQNMVIMNYILLVLIMVMTTLITLYFYLRVMFGAFMFMNQDTTWPNYSIKNSLNNMIMGISILGIPMLLMMSII